MELIVTIIIVVVIKLIKQNSDGTTQIKKRKKHNIWNEVTSSSYQTSGNSNTSITTDWQAKAKENIAKAAARAKQKSQGIGKGTLEKGKHAAGQSSNRQVNYRMPKRTVRTTPVQMQLNQNQTSSSQIKNVELTASQQIRRRQMENKNMSILQRARENAAEEAKDETLHSMQIQHGHAESVSLTTHNHPEDMVSDNVLGTISDLMIKGYEGNLCFERDFLGEAMDMIGRFQPPTEVPDYNMLEMKF